MMILSTAVDVTAVVRPVCLWGQDDSIPPDIINQEGLVRFQTASFYDSLSNQATVMKHSHLRDSNVPGVYLGI